MRTHAQLVMAFVVASATAAVPHQATAQVAPAPVLSPAARDFDQARPRAVEHSDFYYKRLAVHRAASYVMLPLVVGEYVIGNQLTHDASPSSGLKSAHGALATGIGVVFGVNTVTGVWNLWESRRDPGNKARKYIHSALLFASDVGFVLTAGAAPESEDDEGQGNLRSRAARHRDRALVSVGLSAVGTVMMWLWK
jgi:hypothetical protein